MVHSRFLVAAKEEVSQRHISASADLLKTSSNFDSEFPHPFPLPSPPTPFRVDSEGGESFSSHINRKYYVCDLHVFPRIELTPQKFSRCEKFPSPTRLFLDSSGFFEIGSKLEKDANRVFIA